MEIIYFVLAFTATIFGSMAGLGGGVIIKPVLDALGQDNLYTISILSSSTVFAMAIVSTVKQMFSGFKFKRVFIFLIIGATSGGIIGKQLFGIIASGLPEDKLKGIQAIILIVLLFVALFRNRLPDYEIENPVISTAIGLLLGTVAAFLGIGGGPINVAVIVMVLAIDIKDAAVVSILIILASQGAKLLAVQATTGFGIYTDLYKLLYMIPGGVAGGLLGASLNRRLNPKTIHRVYNIILIIIILINSYNAATVFIL